MTPRDSKLEYPFTEERLEAIIAGLDINPKDIVLAVGGSGDQAFALLEKAKRVLVVDLNPSQIDYIQRRVKLLQDEDYKGFLEIPECEDGDGWGKSYRTHLKKELVLRNWYFTCEKREKLDRIRENLSNLCIARMSVFEIPDAEGIFSKIYLSNALGYKGLQGESVNDYGDAQNIMEQIRKVCTYLQCNGLIYMSGNDVKITLGSQKLPKEFGLELDEDLTALARELEHECTLPNKGDKEKNWVPAVYRKIQEPEKME